MVPLNNSLSQIATADWYSPCLISNSQYFWLISGLLARLITRFLPTSKIDEGLVEVPRLANLGVKLVDVGEDKHGLEVDLKQHVFVGSQGGLEVVPVALDVLQVLDVDFPDLGTGSTVGQRLLDHEDNFRGLGSADAFLEIDQIDPCQLLIIGELIPLVVNKVDLLLVLLPLLGKGIGLQGIGRVEGLDRGFKLVESGRSKVSRFRVVASERLNEPFQNFCIVNFVNKFFES